MLTTNLQAVLDNLPAKPGVYLMKDSVGRIIYVGKADSLRDRVRGYFGSQSGLPIRTVRMVEKVADIDYILTDSVSEALILECNLIKKHHPRFNVRLKDDKSYPYVKITLAEEYPRVFRTRKLVDDGSRYFGPFANARSVDMSLNFLRRMFPFRTCHSKMEEKGPRIPTLPAAIKSRQRACLDYDIKLCLGPCVEAVSKEEYRAMIESIILFLEGRQEKILRDLYRRMKEAAAETRFERAAAIRDQIRAIEKTIEEQKITAYAGGDYDLVALASSGTDACVQVFYIRNGKMLGREHFFLETAAPMEAGEILGSFLKQYYNSAAWVPPRIYVQSEVEEAETLRQFLEAKRQGRVEIIAPKRGKKRDLMEMAEVNAREALSHEQARRLASEGQALRALTELREALGLEKLPRRIEGYDISNIAGTLAVGSMVVFENGQPQKSQYRRFQVRTIAGADDYAMLREVLRRRFKRGMEEERRWPWPDLIVVDGGKGQLSSALEVIEDSNVPVAVMALAKEQEEVFLPGRTGGLLLSRTSPALYLIQRLRDEAHRFALAYHQKVRHRAATTSLLDEIPGVGAKRKRALLRRFGSIKGIKEADVGELAGVPGITRKIAKQVKDML